MSIYIYSFQNGRLKCTDMYVTLLLANEPQCSVLVLTVRPLFPKPESLSNHRVSLAMPETEPQNPKQLHQATHPEASQIRSQGLGSRVRVWDFGLSVDLRCIPGSITDLGSVIQTTTPLKRCAQDTDSKIQIPHPTGPHRYDFVRGFLGFTPLGLLQSTLVGINSPTIIQIVATTDPAPCLCLPRKHAPSGKPW